MPIAFSLALELYNVWMKMIADALWAVSGSAATSLCCSMECRWEGSALTAGTALSKSFVSMACHHILADCMLGSLPGSCRAQAIRGRPQQRQCIFLDHAGLPLNLSCPTTPPDHPQIRETRTVFIYQPNHSFIFVEFGKEPTVSDRFVMLRRSLERRSDNIDTQESNHNRTHVRRCLGRAWVPSRRHPFPSLCY